MEKVVASLPGYASVRRASEVLHLAQRSVRDLIYSGRLPSLRVGRMHYIKATDLEIERRRRLGVPRQRRAARPTPQSTSTTAPPTRHSTSTSTTARRASPPRGPRQQSLDAELRRQRAAERAELVSRWARRHGVVEPHVPARVLAVSAPLECDVCGRTLRSGRVIELLAEAESAGGRLCPTCGRRALLDWADRRRLEAAAARRLSQSLGEPEAEATPSPSSQPAPAPDVRAA